MNAPVRRLARRQQGDESGAVAIIVAAMVIVLFGMAALGVDIAQQVRDKQDLRDTMDTAAHAGAYELPGNGAGAAAAALSMAQANDLEANPVADLWCVVASTGTPPVVDETQIPSTCDPGDPPYTLANPDYNPGLACNGSICAIPCEPVEGDICNTIRVADSATVPFAFAPAIGVDEGNTGHVVSVACKGSCGTASPNPLDIVIMADRTASMSSSDRDAMKQAILNSLQTMNDTMHHVAFGTLHKSRITDYTMTSEFQRPEAPYTPDYEDCSVYRRGSRDRDRCEDRNEDREDDYEEAMEEWEEQEEAFVGSTGWDGSGDTNGDGKCLTEAVRTAGRSASSTRSEGTWVPVNFTSDYLDDASSLVQGSSLVDSVNCLYESASGEYGTHLAGALKGAARFLLAGNSTPGASTRPGLTRKVIIFETDGQPDEVGSAGGSTSLADPGDVFGGAQSSSSGSRTGKKSCENFLDVARRAKEAGILVVTVGFGNANSAGCEKLLDYPGELKVRDVLAAAASPVDSSTPSTASACNDQASIDGENNDGDYFFCAAEGSELSDIFRTAISQVSGNIRLIKLP